MLSHRNFLANCDSLSCLGIITEKDTVVSILPLHHAYSLTVTMILPLLTGSSVIYPGSLRADLLLRAMDERNPTLFVGVPQIFYSLYQKMKERLDRLPFPLGSAMNLFLRCSYSLRKATGMNAARFLFFAFHRKFGRKLRLFVSGGAKLNEDVAHFLFGLGFTILEGYGLTETAPVLTLNPVMKQKIGSVGMPVPGVEVRIRDANAEGDGEVIVRGANVMEGYYRRPDLTARVVVDSWFYTGDLGHIDPEGYLFLTGRSKDVIVLASGLNIYPEDIEALYGGRLPIKEMCVFDVSRGSGAGRHTILWAVIRPDLDIFRKFGEVNLRDIMKERIDNVSRELPHYKRIMGFSITLEELPRTLLGKLKRFAVKEAFASHIGEEAGSAEMKKEGAGGDREAAESDMARRILGYLKKKSGLKKEISLGDSFEIDLGIDSLARIELLSGLEDLLNIRIEDEIVGQAFTVGDLLGRLDDYMKTGPKTPATEGGGDAPGEEGYWRRLLSTLPREGNLRKIDLAPGLGTRLVNLPFTAIAYGIFKVFFRLRIEGRENVPLQGPYIIYANHSTYFDGPLIAVSVPHSPDTDLFFVGFNPYFDVPVIRNLIRVGRIIPIDFSSHLAEALRSSYYVLKNGKRLCLFPEGMRTIDGKIGEFKKGFGIVVAESGVPVLPALIEGAHAAWPRTSRYPRLRPIRVRFGKALEAAYLEKKGVAMGARDRYEAVALAAQAELKKIEGQKA